MGVFPVRSRVGRQRVGSVSVTGSPVAVNFSNDSRSRCARAGIHRCDTGYAKAWRADREEAPPCVVMASMASIGPLGRRTRSQRTLLVGPTAGIMGLQAPSMDE